jgi:hypothetical protein
MADDKKTTPSRPRLKVRRVSLDTGRENVVVIFRRSSADLTGLFWTKLCEKLSLERSFGDAEEEVQRGADRGAAPSDRSVDVAG